ncbi:precorrin-6y C5,15-methyltransferase (decarboxylating) subunit CbiE [Pseudohoeflea coraliihabitans]|uniref:Precorrin-6y C5,15-methyltransferase (Decarboxylating) subunit CbiE n=1 Tax=Pseudohoeflea coraliihabitans TaxID=2860393 RepID=A0ABS6WIH7_9HYPH|nr:precorrin-6y C5,15-methyltransferase (decarboxylating) subunit CbiE [Pseudohoeflea sp. DP4N28-3]MBW3095746.1 precorrin-6y C5,15-methyltransferase (decarboxylating) subunit CbiE [Pseudohoeflea sp. DP4N28-3]
MAEASPWLTILGIGDDGLDSLTPPARTLFEQARTIIAPQRVLEKIDCGDREVIAWTFGVKETIALLKARRGTPVTVLATGDPMHFGIGATLLRNLQATEMRVLPSPSAFSLAAARLGWPLQEVAAISLHGRSVHALAAQLFPGQRILALTSTGRTVHEAAALLRQHGYGRSALSVLEHMGGRAERCLRLTAAELDETERFADFNTLAIECLADAGSVPVGAVPGLPDQLFEHDGQLTKREIRAVTLAHLAPRPAALLWDIGAGCGSVAIEWMRAAPGARAIAIEQKSERRALIAANALALGVPTLDIREGRAPEALAGLAPPDAVFIGGGLSDAALFDALWPVLKAGGRLVANAVTVEGEARLIALQAAHGGELVRMQISRAEPVGRFHGWKPLMPVTLWSVRKEAAA